MYPMHGKLFNAMIALLIMTYVLPRLYYFIDEKIEGKWSEQTPLKYLSHPHPDFQLSGEDIIVKYGHNLESFYVTTEDGYVNHMHRINKFSEAKLNSSKPKAAVLLIHGHLDSSDTWILNEEKSIAF